MKKGSRSMTRRGWWAHYGLAGLLLGGLALGCGDGREQIGDETNDRAPVEHPGDPLDEVLENLDDPNEGLGEAENEVGRALRAC